MSNSGPLPIHYDIIDYNFISLVHDQFQEKGYKIDLVSSVSPRPKRLSSNFARPDSSPSRRPRSNSMPTPGAKIESLNLDKICNENFTSEFYSKEFWTNSFLHKAHQTYLGYDEDLGPVCVSLLKKDKKYLVYIRTIYKFKAITIDNALLVPTKGQPENVLSPKAGNIIIYLAFEKYLSELEDEWFQLEKWYKSTKFQCPSMGEPASINPAECETLSKDISDKIRLHVATIEVVRSNLNKIVSGLESIDDLSILSPLKYTEVMMMKKYYNNDIILLLEPDQRTPSQRDTFKMFKRMLGSPLIKDGVKVVSKSHNQVKLDNPVMLQDEEIAEKRSDIIHELTKTEDSYLKKLNGFIEVYLNPLQSSSLSSNKIISQYDITSIFKHIEEIYDVNKAFSKDLSSLNENVDGLGAVCLKHLKKFNVYQNYIVGYKHSEKYSSDLEKKNNRYWEFLREARESDLCYKLGIKDLLVMPVQRIPRYVLLFTDLLELTPKDHPDYKPLLQALNIANDISHLNQNETSEHVVELTKLLYQIEDCPASLVHASRKLITQFDCDERDICKSSFQAEVTLFLFNDYIMVAQRTFNSNKKFKYLFVSWISLSDIDILDGQTIGKNHGFYLKINNTAVEDIYWDSQAVHYYTSPMFQIKQQFINKFSYLKAEHRALEIGCSLYQKVINDVSLYFFVMEQKDYQKTKARSEVSLTFVEDIEADPSKYFLENHSALVHGILTGNKGKFGLMMRSRVSCAPLSNILSATDMILLTPEHPSVVGQDYQLPFLFQGYLMQNLLYSHCILRGSISYFRRQHYYNKAILESLFGLHFPVTKLSHPYLHKVKSFVRVTREGRISLHSTGTPLVPSGSFARKRPPFLGQARNALGHRSSGELRSMTNLPQLRNLSDPLTAAPTQRQTIYSHRGSNSVSPQNLGIPKATQKKKRSSFQHLKTIFSNWASQF